MLRSSGVEALLKGKYNLTYYFQYLWHALLYCSQINRSFRVCVIVHKSIDCTWKWWLFMRLYECMMQRCMFTVLRNWMPQRDYVCMCEECIFKFMNLPTQTSLRENVCMYVCEDVCLWFYWNECYNVSLCIPWIPRQMCMISDSNVTIKLQ